MLVKSFVKANFLPHCTVYYVRFTCNKKAVEKRRLTQNTIEYDYRVLRMSMLHLGVLGYKSVSCYIIEYIKTYQCTKCAYTLTD